jgi:hypothetical protein
MRRKDRSRSNSRKADRKRIDRTRLEQGKRLARLLHLEHQAALDLEAGRGFAEPFPDADGRAGVVLPQHLDRGRPRGGGAEGAGLDQIADHVAIAEGRGQALEDADLDAVVLDYGFDRLELEGHIQALGRAQGFGLRLHGVDSPRS